MNWWGLVFVFAGLCLVALMCVACFVYFIPFDDGKTLNEELQELHESWVNLWREAFPWLKL